eukprot:gene12997-14250_t
MDLTEEFAGYYQIHRSEDTILVEKRPSKFLLQATGVYSKITSYETLLKASYEGFIGIHRFLPEEMIRSSNIIYFNEQERRKFIEETALFISTTAKDIQDINYQMETLLLDLHHNQPKIFYQQVVSQLLTKLNKFTRLWDRMQKESKKYHHTPFRLFSYLYQDTKSITVFQRDGDDRVASSSSQTRVLQPHDQLSLLQETADSNEKSKGKSSSQSSRNTSNQLENSFAQRYIDEIATKQKMKEYQSIATKEKENLLKEAKLLHHKYNVEVIQSQQIENTVMNISSLVGEFATLIQSQTEIVENIGDATDEVTKSIKKADDELLSTVERTQSQQWNMMIVISSIDDSASHQNSHGIVNPLILQSIKQKHFQQFSFNSSSTCKAMHFKEGKELPCTFEGAHCPMEVVEHEFVYKYVRSSDAVLELGARYGTTTCAIACTLKNSGKVVVNVKSHSCASTVFFGAVSDVPLAVLDQGYGTRTLQPLNATKEVITASSSHMMLHQLHKVMDMQFTVLLIDCEGCITHLLPDNLQRLSHLLRHVRVILLEGDMSNLAPDCFIDCVDYDIWKKRFMEIGFAVVEETTDPNLRFIKHYAFVRKE